MTPRPVETVGFIGLGDMGGAIVDRIVADGHRTVLWARRREALVHFEGVALVAESPAALAAQADLIGICVWTDEDVREVLEGDRGVLAGCRPGTIVAVHSTVLPATCRELARAAAERGIHLIDAPVSGGRAAAGARSLAVTVGGDPVVVERCRHVFESFGNPVVHVGPVGAGQVVKLVNNTLVAANIGLAEDALTIGVSQGIPVEVMATVLQAGSGRSFGLDVAARIWGSPERRQRALSPLQKDVHSFTLAVSSDDRASVSMLVAAANDAIRRLAERPVEPPELPAGSRQLAVVPGSSDEGT